MTSIYAAGASGMRAQQTRLDTVANNLANLTTPGFRASRATTADLPQQPLEVARAGDAVTGRTELAEGTTIAAITRAYHLGPLHHTSSPTDLAILGPDAFFQITTADGQIAYTRDGSFRVDPTGMLVNGDGDPVYPAVTLPEGARITDITPEGVIMGVLEDGDPAVPVELGQLMLARFPNPDGLLQIGQNRFVASEVSGDPVVGEPGENGFPVVQSYTLESSNVDLAEQMALLIEAQRAYSMNVRSVQALDEMVAQIIQTRQ